MSIGANEKSGQYAMAKLYVLVTGIALNILLLAVFQVYFSGRTSVWAHSLTGNFYLACFVFVTVFFSFLYLLSFPLHYFSSFYLERSFGLSDQKVSSWLADELKSTVLSFFMTVLAAHFFYVFLRNFPEYWWAVTALSWVFFSIVLARVFPVVIVPLFHKYIPIDDVSLKQQIFAVGKKEGVNISDICRIDLSRKTRKANAALIGLGRSRKIVLGDTLTDNFNIEEILAVVAHEMAHHKYRHITRLIAFSGIVTLSGFYVFSHFISRVAGLFGADGISDLKIFPVFILAFTVFSLLLLPLQNLFSRNLERQADREALDIMQDPEAFISAMRKLADTNLAEMDPHPLKKVFLYSHPPIAERIKVAAEWGK